MKGIRKESNENLKPSCLNKRMWHWIVQINILKFLFIIMIKQTNLYFPNLLSSFFLCYLLLFLLLQSYIMEIKKRIMKLIERRSKLWILKFYPDIAVQVWRKIPWSRLFKSKLINRTRTIMMRIFQSIIGWMK